MANSRDLGLGSLYTVRLLATSEEEEPFLCSNQEPEGISEVREFNSAKEGKVR